MALKEMIVNWNDGVNAYLDGEYQEAINKFESIEDGSAKIYFNTACAYLQLNKTEAALVNLNETVKKDQHLAIGHFHRGLQQVKVRRYETGLRDFESAIQKMRGLPFIDYTQLGMTYKLFLSEISIGKAVALSRQGRHNEAEEVLITASQEADDDESKRKCVAALQKLRQSNGPSKKRKSSLRDEEWFHGKLPREEAENMLVNQGDFLVRESRNRKTNDVQYVLSVYWQGVRHIIFLQDEEDYWKFEGTSFPTIEELVNYQFKTGQHVTKRSRAKLITPVPKEDQSMNSSLELPHLPESCIFHPPKELIANLEKRNYLGKAKVITSYSIREKKRSQNRNSQPESDEDDVSRPPRPIRPPPVLNAPSQITAKHTSTEDNFIGSRNAHRPPPSLPSKLYSKSYSRSLEDINKDDNLLSPPPQVPKRPSSSNSSSNEDLIDSRSERSNRSPLPSRKPPNRYSESSEEVGDDWRDRWRPSGPFREQEHEVSGNRANSKFKNTLDNELANVLNSRNRNVPPPARKNRNSLGEEAPPRPPPIPRRK